jgi:hypothetical protein
MNYWQDRIEALPKVTTVDLAWQLVAFVSMQPGIVSQEDSTWQHPSGSSALLRARQIG